MDMYAANIYFWRRYRVNYSFIFGFKQGTELGYRHVLLLSFGLGTLSLCAVLLNLDMEMDAQTKDYRLVTELIPLFLLVVSSFYVSLFLSTFYTTQSLFLVRLVSLHIAVSDCHFSLPLSHFVSVKPILLPLGSVPLHRCTILRGTNNTLRSIHLKHKC